MKSNFLLLVSLVLSLNVFSAACPEVITQTVVTSGAPGSPTCTVYVQTVVRNTTGADKGFRIQVYLGIGTAGTLLSDSCKIVPGGTNLDYTYRSADFACGGQITVVTTGKTSSNNLCGGGTCESVVQYGTGNPGVVLPVKLTSFNANIANGVVSLKWTSESEVNFQNYQVEINDGSGFKTLGSVLAKNNGLANSYNFNHNVYSKQSVQYRLKLIDIDGKFTYSNIVLVKADNQSFDFNIYPNPSTAANTNILVSGLSNDGRIQIIDMTGKVLKTLVVNGNNVKVGYLPTGVYMVKVSNAGTAEQVTKRMVIVN